MNKKLLIAALCLLGTYAADAQFNYTVSTQHQTYAPLTGGTNVNGSTKWDNENYKVPLGFRITINAKDTTSYFSFPPETFATDTSFPYSGFAMITADMWDRGNATGGASSSPIRYTVTGTAPNRIFKMEQANAGFADEMPSFSTNNDFVNIQVWVHETTNVIELHYGPSNISHVSSYFQPAGKPVIGFINNYQLSGSFTKAYYFKGGPSNPSLDSAVTATAITGLDSFPKDGTVYIFTPLPSSVLSLSLNGAVTAYPNPVKDEAVLSLDLMQQQYVGVTVYDITGKLVYTLPAHQYAAGKSNIQVPMGRLTPGLYIYKLTDEGNGVLYNGKLMKE